jgi:hypothetical protein
LKKYQHKNWKQKRMKGKWKKQINKRIKERVEKEIGKKR